jgi:peptidyl-Lys metalloendopeptidase
VTFSLSTSKTSFASDEDVLIQVKVKNNELNKPARVLKWIVPCDVDNPTSSESILLRDMSSIEVKTLGGLSAKYLGVMVKRGAPSDKDYLRLGPGAEISCTINLENYFEFISPSDDEFYEVKFTAISSQLSAPYASNKSTLETLKSGTLSLQIAARNAPTRALRERKLQAINNFKNCDWIRQAFIIDARQRAAAAATDALQKIDDVGTWRNAAYCPRYKEWFGDYDYNRHMNELRPGYSRVRDRLNDSPIVFNCACEKQYENAFAYVLGWRPYEIYLCNRFWSAQMTGTDSKMASVTSPF